MYNLRTALFIETQTRLNTQTTLNTTLLTVFHCNKGKPSRHAVNTYLKQLCSIQLESSTLEHLSSPLNIANLTCNTLGIMLLLEYVNICYNYAPTIPRRNDDKKKIIL